MTLQKKIAIQLVYFVLLLYKKTLRYQRDPSYLHPTGPTLIGSWHEYLLPTVLCYIGPNYSTLVSQSKDGDFVAPVFKKFGHEVIRGSSSKGGKSAIIALTEVLHRGKSVGITVDGPRGPRRVPKFGIFKLAQSTGCPLIGTLSVPKHAFVFKKSWDQFQLPYPFSKVIIGSTPPIPISQNEVIEAQSDCIQHFMSEMDKLHTHLRSQL